MRQLEFLAGCDYERLTFFAEAEQFAVVRPGRSRERSGCGIDAGFVSLLPGFCFVAIQDAGFGQRVDRTLISDL